MESFFDPSLTIHNLPYKSYKYENVLKEQLLIAYLSKGAVTISEVADMPIPDRKIILSTLRQVQDAMKRNAEEQAERRRLKGTPGSKL
jgi:hypothetical protein